MTPPFVNISQVKNIIDSTGIHIQFQYKSNSTINPQIWINCYKDEVLCGSQVYYSKYDQKSQTYYFTLPYTKIFIPKGQHFIQYKIFINNEFYTNTSFYSSTVNIEQPQLYWMRFESDTSEIDVEKLDRPSHLGKMFSSKAGRGKGDAFYEIYQNDLFIFRSPKANQSGKIPASQSAIQVHPQSMLYLKFWDYDVISKEFIHQVPIHIKEIGSYHLDIKNENRIRNFKLKYEIIPVTLENYEGFFKN